MHYTVCEIFPVEPDVMKNYRANYAAQRDQYLDIFSEHSVDTLSFFDMNREVEPYRRYLDSEEIGRMSKAYQTTDLKILSEQLADWSGFGGGVDDKGLYELTTRNPDGKFDSWNIFEILPTTTVRDQLEQDRIPFALILPGGTWVSDEVYSFGGDPKAMDNWVEKVKLYLAEFPNA